MVMSLDVKTKINLIYSQGRAQGFYVQFFNLKLHQHSVASMKLSRSKVDANHTITCQAEPFLFR